MEIKFEKWKVGKSPQVVVTDNPEGFDSHTGHLESEYFGGILICESIWRPKDSHLISATYDMLEVLFDIENDNGQIPDAIWEKRNEAISKALGVNDWTKIKTVLKY